MRGTVEGELYELLLPGEGALVRQLQLQAAALTVVYLGVVRDLQPPEHLSHPGGHDVAGGVPLHPAQQPGVVGVVTKPGTFVQQVHSVQDFLLRCRLYELLLKPPHFCSRSGSLDKLSGH